MAISEEIHLAKQSPVTTPGAEYSDDPCVHRLQSLIAELLLKNELLRHQLRRDACMFERLRSLVEKEAQSYRHNSEVISPLLQAYWLLAREG